jgi:hypothetical protein
VGDATAPSSSCDDDDFGDGGEGGAGDLDTGRASPQVRDE